jgi:predicted nuclease of restriction endonuclease-like (RecB) superfamily
MKNEQTVSVDAPNLTLERVAEAIAQTHRHFSVQAGKAVNMALTLRNWMIGCHIELYERNGTDRATYGDKLMDSLAESLQQRGLNRCDRRELYRYRQLYLTYPQIVESMPPQFTAQLSVGQIRESVTPQSISVSGRQLVECLSFTHLVELIQIDDAEKRTFYEAECMRALWSVRELKRQIASLYYERSALSHDKKKLAAQTPIAVSPATTFPIRDPYVFEFLGLKPQEVMGESQLEDQLLDHLQTFLLELGHGFCFEARQKRILIGHARRGTDMTKRRIDYAMPRHPRRQGARPQIDSCRRSKIRSITIALIYKFMDDMDAEAKNWAASAASLLANTPATAGPS